MSPRRPKKPHVIAVLENGFFSGRRGTIIDELPIIEEVGVIFRDVDGDDDTLTGRIIRKTFLSSNVLRNHHARENREQRKFRFQGPSRTTNNSAKMAPERELAREVGSVALRLARRVAP